VRIFHVFEEETKQQYRFHFAWPRAQQIGLAALPQRHHQGTAYFKIYRLQRKFCREVLRKTPMRAWLDRRSKWALSLS